MAHAAVMVPWTVTGARPATPRQAPFVGRSSGARAVRTRRGCALFDDTGHYVGAIVDPTGYPTFGPGAGTVLLHRSSDREAV
jgi:hypothetical protein